jgi:hypothetical protein
MAKTHFGVMDFSGNVTITHKIDLSKVKSKDPIAYAYGLAQGLRGESIQKSEEKLASEYIRGWNDGHKNYEKKLRKVM